MADNYRTAASNFPAGFNNVTVRGVPITQSHPGQVFWVSNATTVLPGQIGGSDGNAGSFNAPFSTLDYAIGACTANRGDIIFIKPGHAETISTATAVALDVAGVAIVGLGTGTKRPTFTLDTANTATLGVSAANISVQNCLFVANFLTIASCFTLSTAANFTLQGCEFRDTSAALNFANVVKSTGAANTVDGLYVADNFYQSIGTTFNTLVLTANDINALQIHSNFIATISTGDIATLCVVSAGVLTGGFITRNNTKRKNTTTTNAMVNVGGTTSSVILRDNFASCLDGTNNINWVVTTGLVGQGNTYSGAIAGQGFTIPALDS
ncbi:hypothetical protein UFOVP1590_22 [uncultured Caudovirales phage]|uniref:Uncharacterized protein n=1 Tax=uncultured Caudovirales phage TaxID=2100421 RepID=A0A6J5SP70_9CAUD|nr:hypothetical protein UFOVP1590_22 [uncultured Caudovirales phage]